MKAAFRRSLKYAVPFGYSRPRYKSCRKEINYQSNGYYNFTHLLYFVTLLSCNVMFNKGWQSTIEQYFTWKDQKLSEDDTYIFVQSDHLSSQWIGHFNFSLSWYWDREKKLKQTRTKNNNTSIYYIQQHATELHTRMWTEIPLLVYAFIFYGYGYTLTWYQMQTYWGENVMFSWLRFSVRNRLYFSVCSPTRSWQRCLPGRAGKTPWHGRFSK